MSRELHDQINSEFLSVTLRPRNMLIYTARTAILESVKEETRSFFGNVLDIGCGFMPYKEIVVSNPTVEKYLGMDLEGSAIYSATEPDLKWNGETIPLPAESVDCVMATEFLEHYSEPEKILGEIWRVMKPGGKFFATVPFIWNLHELPHDEYRYTPYSLEKHLTRVGLTNIEIKALGGWNKSLAQMIGLWTEFSRMPGFVRPVIKAVLFPVFALLIKTDRKPAAFDGFENSMFPGLSVTANKP